MTCSIVPNMFPWIGCSQLTDSKATTKDRLDAGDRIIIHAERSTDPTDVSSDWDEEQINNGFRWFQWWKIHGTSIEHDFCLG